METKQIAEALGMTVDIVDPRLEGAGTDETAAVIQQQTEQESKGEAMTAVPLFLFFQELENKVNLCGDYSVYVYNQLKM